MAMIEKNCNCKDDTVAIPVVEVLDIHDPSYIEDTDIAEADTGILVPGSTDA